MSTLSQFFPNGTKSIQRGVIALNSATSATATLSPAVDTAKTRLRFLGFSCAAGALEPDQFTYIVLTNSTTVTAVRSDVTGNVSVSWEIEESY